MNAHNRIARLVGVLYIIGTVSGVLSVVFGGSILDKSDYLTEIAAHDNQLVLGALFVLTMGLVLAVLPVLVYPILKKQNEVLALGYVVFRGALETFAYLATVIVWLMLISVSREYVKTGEGSSLGGVLLETGDWIGGLTTIVFILGALMFYYALYQSKLVPRWLSGCGLIGAAPYLAAGILPMFDVIEVDSSTQTLLFMPLALQEMVMAIWLIVKGFNSSAVAQVKVREVYT